jgi:putative ABC transport system substrate-binding protein
MKPIRIVALALALLLALPLAASAETPKAPIKVGIIQLVQHAALDASCQGFLDALADAGYIDGDTIVVDFQNGQGDQSNLGTIADRFVANQADIVLAIATPAALAIAGKTNDIPILCTAITDFVSARLVETNEKPGTNVSGTSDMASIADQIALIAQFSPDAKTVGVLYNAGEVNSVVQAEAAKAAIEALGYAYVEKTVTSSNDVQQAVEAISKQCDALYLPTDNVIASSMPIVYGVAVDAKLPVFCGEEGMVRGGGLVTLGINYYKLGWQTGEMAVRLIEQGLTAENIQVMPIEWQTEFDYAINATFAKEIGIQIPDELQQFAFEMD